MADDRRHNVWVLSGLACGALLLPLLAADALRGSDRLLHWFLLPVALCGILILVDAIRWWRGDVDALDPAGLIGLFGVHFFLLAPLLHVGWDFWMYEVEPPADWRPWLGGMAALNCVGLLAYRAALARFGGDAGPSRSATTWRIEPRRFGWCLGGALLLAAALQLGVYASYGGVWGYISAVEQREHSFLGSSRLAMVTGSFPILAMMGYAVYVTYRRKTPSWAVLILVLAAFAALRLLFGGLAGCRSNTILTVLWGVGLVHFWVRPIPKKLVLGGIAGLLAFAYFYGFYKSGGLEGLQRALASSENRAALADEIHRPIQSTVLADFGRSDVQGFLLYRLTRWNSDYQYAFGRTYLGAVLALLPGPLWPDRPPTKVKEGTEALRGRGAYRERPVGPTYYVDRNVGMSSRLYGLAGEAMLNFGPVGVPAAFFVFGAVVAMARRAMFAWRRRDARRLLTPFLLVVCFVLLANDSDNLVVLLEEYGAFPLLVVAIASRRQRRDAHGP